jgi:hypothetical protein
MCIWQLKSFESKQFANKVCKLEKFIYRIEQASKSWNIYFDGIIKEFDFIRNMDEPCIYKKYLWN